MLMLETSRVNAGSTALRDNQGIHKTDWEMFILQLAREITMEQSPQKLIRNYSAAAAEGSSSGGASLVNRTLAPPRDLLTKA